MEYSSSRGERRSRRPSRRPERQQIMLRRLLALGAALVVLILVVLGVKGCLDSRARGALTDYAGDVEQIVNETSQTSKDFFGKLEDPGNLSVTEFSGEVDADRSAMDTLLGRVEGLSAPGEMGGAQKSLEIVYELRDAAMDTIADEDENGARRSRGAAGDGGDRAADAEAARLRRHLRIDHAAGNQRQARRQRDRRPRSAEEHLRPRRDQVARRSRSGESAGPGERHDRRRARRRASTASAWSGCGSAKANWCRKCRTRWWSKARRKSKSKSKTRANRPRTGSPWW